jgi:hypothetical protein
MQALKHVGRIKGTNKKCLVAFRTLPGDAYHALVIHTEALPDELHNAIINLVESNSAQTSYEFAEALDRTQFPDGSRMLPNLHQNGRLVKMPTDQIEMTPNIGASILLSELNQIIAEQRGIAVDELHVPPGSNDKSKEIATAKELPVGTVSVNETVPEVTTFDNAESEAKHYRSQADKLAKQAAEFRRKAEELVPTKKAK